MFKINYQNALDKNINKKFLLKELKKHENLIDEIFNKESEFGYNFLSLTNQEKNIKEIKNFTKEELKNKWENIVVLGIGGSALGLSTIQETLFSKLYNLKNKPKLFVLDNVDPDYINEVLEIINLKKTLIITISKSGGTAEVMMLYSIFRNKFKKEKITNIKKHFIFITGKKNSLLESMANKEKLRSFEVPEKIGGRFSVLTNVALLPASLINVDIKKIVLGAKKMKEIIKKEKLDKNPALLLAVLQFLTDKKEEKNMTVLMSYSEYMNSLNEWYKQLLAESIGKNEDVGITAISAKGTTDQHSQLQLFAEGPNNKFFIFFKVLNYKNKLSKTSNLPNEIDFLNNKNLSNLMHSSEEAVIESLRKKNRTNIEIEIEKLNEETLGALFFLFEFQIALLGLLYKVNAFNQPGVEEAKKISKKKISKL